MFSVRANCVLPGENDPSYFPDISTYTEASLIAKNLYDKIFAYFTEEIRKCSTIYQFYKLRNITITIYINDTPEYTLNTSSLFPPSKKDDKWFLCYESGLHNYDIIAMYDNEHDAKEALTSFPTSGSNYYYVKHARQYNSGELEFDA